MNGTNNISARQTFEQAKRLLFNAMISKFIKVDPLGITPTPAERQNCQDWVDSRKLSQSEIRLEVELNNASNSFTFAPTLNQANSTNVIFPCEQRLNLQDTLIASEYAIQVAMPTSRADTTFLLRTYGNPQDFNAAQAAAIDGQFFSNGQYVLKVNNDVVAPIRGLVNHLYRGQTQETAPLGAGAPNDQFRGAEDGYITSEPNLLLIGSKAYVPQIVLQNALVPAMGFARAILTYRGVLAQNSTVVN